MGVKEVGGGGEGEGRRGGKQKTHTKKDLSEEHPALENKSISTATSFPSAVKPACLHAQVNQCIY